MKAIRLRTEDLKEPLGLGNPTPRFSWNCQGGVTQTAYQIVCTRAGETVWDSGRVESGAMTHIRYEGQPLHSRDNVTWAVTLWDENGEAGESAEGRFELGLLGPADWQAQWISGNYKPKKNQRYPVDCFRKEFAASGKIAKARLYATARGLYDVTLNGRRVEDFILAPGMTDYRKRIQYQTYDVTALLGKQNTMELRLADGWYRGSSAAYGVTNVYGAQTSVLAQLEVTYEDGRRETICTDNTWRWSNDGPLRFADLKDGEVVDANCTPSYGGRAKVVAAPKAALVASDNVPVTEHERLSPERLPNNVLDFGQNIAGYLELTVRGRQGQRIKLVCGELLDEAGNVDLTNMQESRPARGWSQMSLIKKLMTNQVKGEIDPTPRQEILFTCSGGEDHYKTSFAVFGFRYVQVQGDAEVEATAIAVYSDLEQTGEFTCSDQRVNKLVENTRWSMKSNYLDLPTDCPTRERLGWTGDAQIFFDTGAYLMDTAAFFRKWLTDMEDAQYPNGLIPAVLPYQGVEMMYKNTGGSVGWADAVYLIPYRCYKRYGDKALLERCWPMMKKYGDYLLSHLGLQDKKQAKENPYNAYTYEKGMHLGEWLEPKEFQESISANSRPRHPEEATAYFHLAMVTLGKIAAILGDKRAALRYKEYAEGSRKAYHALFVETGTLDTDRQAKLVRPLALGLLEGEDKKAAQLRLKQAVEQYHYRVGTGFLSTAFLLPVLTEAGEMETAYRLLLNEECPGWLYEVLHGATTVWENWEGVSTGENNSGSLNHYSPGAVCQWLFDTVAGIRVDGENHFIIAPLPGGPLTHAGASYRSPYGKVESRWEREGEKITYTVTVPANCTAEVQLPGREPETVAAGTRTYTQ